MIWLIIAAVAFAAVLLWMLIETRSTMHLLWVIPTCIGLITGTYQFYSSVLGYPTDQYEVGGKFVLVSYFPLEQEDKLIVWVVLDGETIPKAITIPWNEKEEKSLRDVTKQMAEGEMFEGEFGEPPPPTGGEGEGYGSEESGGGFAKSSGGLLNFTKLTVESFLPKKGYMKEEE